MKLARIAALQFTSTMENIIWPAIQFGRVDVKPIELVNDSDGRSILRIYTRCRSRSCLAKLKGQFRYPTQNGGSLTRRRLLLLIVYP